VKELSKKQLLRENQELREENGGYQKVSVWGHNLEIEENDQREEGYEVRRFDRRAFGKAWDKRKRVGKARYGAEVPTV
jgi:hypothetical protein